MRNLRPFFLAILSALFIAAAWWVPGTLLCAVLGWVGALILVGSVLDPKSSYLSLGLQGVFINCLGFYWLFGTIKNFGGFDYFAAASIFLLFIVVSANQQILFLFIYRNLPKFFDKVALRITCAWIVAEFFSLRIFPWSLGHTQLAATAFIQSADIFGTPIIAFLMLWLCDAIWKAAQRKSKIILAMPITACLAALVYGNTRISHYRLPTVENLPVTLIQANITTAEKRNIRYFLRNKERYEAMSKAEAKEGALIIWPESVITDFIPDAISSAAQDDRLPFLGPNTAMLVGALTYRSREEIFNSALAILPNGAIPPPYHKRILMPFGEFTPFSESLPWLKTINSTAGEFTPGKEVAVFEYRFSAPAPLSVRVSPLICYEDIAPALARDATRAGADLLVNITNDAWFGKTVAPHQHHLIAAFRAIENRRYLLRSTNSGLTAIVNPLGETVAKLEPFSEGVINYTVGLRRESSYYTSVFGEQFWWALCGFLVILSVGNVALKRSKDGFSARSKRV